MAPSSTPPVWSAVVENGQLLIDARRAFRAYVRSLAGKPLEVIVRPFVRHRSTPQVAYYFSTVIPALAHEIGYRRDEHYQLHDGLMHKFWPLPPDPLTGSPRRRRLTLKEPGSEPPLNHDEMGIHLEQVIMFAAERGCVIPEPNKRHRERRAENRGGAHAMQEAA